MQLSQFELRNAQWELSRMEDFITNSLVYQLRAFVATHQKDVTFSAPADWWEAFRERWFPKWWLARHPVRYRTETVSIRDHYPELVLPPKCGPALRLLVGHPPTLTP